MIKEIPLKGITTTPDNYLSKDGDLQYALNCASQDGSLTNPPQTSTFFWFPNKVNADGSTSVSDYSLIYIHETGSYTNYILWNEYNKELLYTGSNTSQLISLSDQYAAIKRQIDNSMGTYYPHTQITSLTNSTNQILNNLPTLDIAGYTKPTSITSVGNMLCITNEAGLQYCLCIDGTLYKILPSKLPHPHFSLSLNGEYKTFRPDEGILLSSNPHAQPTNNTICRINGVNVQWTSRKYNLIFGTEQFNKDFLGAGIYSIIINPRYLGNLTTLSDYGQAHAYIFYTDTNGEEHQMYFKTNTGTQSPLAPCIRLEDNFANRNLYERMKSRISLDMPVEFTSLRIELHCYSDNTFTWQFDAVLETTEYAGSKIVMIDNDNINSHQVVTSAVKRFINQYSVKKSRFMYPFQARIAFKTQDNHYICPSAPVLLIPNAGQSPVVRCGSFTSDSQSVDIYLSAIVADLQLYFPNRTEYSEWTDIISSIVIAITRPIYSYNQSIEKQEDLQTEMFVEDITTDSSRFCIAQINNVNVTTPQKTLESTLFNTFNSTTTDGFTEELQIHLPVYDSAETKMLEDDHFYIVKEIPFSDIIDQKYNSFKTIDLSSISFDSLVNNRYLPDDYSSLNSYKANQLYALNNRLHIANYKQYLFEGWHINHSVQYEQTCPYNYKSFITIKQDSHTYIIENKFGDLYQNSGNIRYFAYPNINAITATIYRYANNSYQKCTIPLKPHPTRNEAYWFDNYNTIPESQWTESTEDNDDYFDKVNRDALSLIPENNTTYEPSKNIYESDRSNYIKISETNNPLIFTDLRTYNFNSPVAAMTSAVTALSTGQKGDFDLYVFTLSDGVWSLKINSEGGYSKQIPVTRDTITNVKSICQLDNSVLFVTDRGIMELHGSDSQCISEDLMRKETISLAKADLPLINILLQNASYLGLYNATSQDGISPEPLDFRTYIQSAQIVYDYRNQRIVVFNPSKTYAYNYNIKSKLWTQIKSTYLDTINSYPESIVQSSDGLVYDLSGNSTTDNQWYSVQQPSFILTRPFSLDLPNEYKIIDQLRINGTGYIQDIGTGRYDSAGNLIITPSHINQILYGSNDLLTWHCISSSKTGRISGKSGTPYRFFRLAILSSLTASETIDSISISYRIKDENTKLF